MVNIMKRIILLIVSFILVILSLVAFINNKELLYVLQSRSIDCETTSLEIYSNNTYKYYYKNNEYKKGKFNENIKEIINNLDKDNYSYSIVNYSINDIEYYTSEELENFLNKYEINLNTCLLYD